MTVDTFNPNSEPMIFRSSQPLPVSVAPSVWRVPLHGNAWEIAAELDAMRRPYELFDDGTQDYFFTVADSDFLAIDVLEDHGCDDASSLATFADGGLTGVDGATQQQHGRLHIGIGRAALKMALLLGVCAGIFFLVYAWGATL